MNTHLATVRSVTALCLSFGIFVFPAADAGSQTLSNPDGALTAEQAAPAPVLGAEAAALKSALEARFGANSSVVAAYAARGFKSVWFDTDGGNAKAAALVGVLSRAGDHALPVAKYGGASLSERIGAGSPQIETELTRVFVEYAQDVGSGLLEPRQVDRELHIYPERADPGVLISNAARAGNLEVYLDGLAPRDPAYRRLVERFAAFRAMANQEIWGPSVRRGRTMRPGDRNGRVATARARLTAMGDLDPNIYDTQSAAVVDGTQIAANETTTDVPLQAFDPNHFDQPMVDALQRFQARHGLNLDGVIGPATLQQLNVSPQTRAQQIAVNLERMRWMNRDLGERHILVNLAGFTMDVMHNDRSEFSSRVVVGKAREHRTPEFSDEMTHMVVNPSWYVPTSIKEKEIMPKVEEDPDYLAKRGMRMLSNGRIVQRPGRGNALGTVKFMFPNQFAIYLHDTPSKRLFKRDVRAYSHGCVRVEKPHEFAEYLLSSQEADPAGYFQSVLRRGRERRVDLLEPVPVHLTYRSAWIDENGVEQFRGDVYGRDKRIANALANAGVSILQ